jgi:hypothetical protein
VDPSRIVFLDVSPLHADIRVYGLFDNFNLNEIDLIVWKNASIIGYNSRGPTGAWLTSS